MSFLLLMLLITVPVVLVLCMGVDMAVRHTSPLRNDWLVLTHRPYSPRRTRWAWEWKTVRSGYPPVVRDGTGWSMLTAYWGARLRHRCVQYKMWRGRRGDRTFNFALN